MTNVLDYLKQKEIKSNEIINSYDEYNSDYQLFYELVDKVDAYLLKIREKSAEKDWNDIQYLALIGDKKGEQEYLQLITDYLKENKKEQISHPKWYRNLSEAIFHEIIGLAGIAEWLYMEHSGTCKVIQPNIYFQENGVLVRKPQKISRERFKKLINTLCQSDYRKRTKDDNIELQIRDGNVRVTIFQNVNKKSSEGAITFRKYVVQKQSIKEGYKFEQLAEKRMFGKEACNLLEQMVKCRFNVNFIGAPNTGKTTLLSYYSSYEDKSLEGITIQSEAEFDSTVLSPNAPIIDFLINEENRDSTKAAILRSDLQWLTYGEVRRGDELDLLLFLATKGITGIKATYHTSFNPEDLPYLVADQIQKDLGAELYPTMLNAAKSFDFLFETINYPGDKSRKLLKGIYELQINPENLRIYSNAICLYDFEKGCWLYNNQLSEATINKATDINYKEYLKFQKILDELYEAYPLPKEKQIRESIYSKLIPHY